MTGKRQVARQGSARREMLPAQLLSDVRGLIEQAREGTARAVNSQLVMLYWSLGRRIRMEVLKERRAEYGQKVVELLAEKLTADYGRGFSKPGLMHMVHFVEVFPDEQIVSPLARQLGWSHFLEIIYLRDPLQRSFYAEMCRIERWSVRALDPPDPCRRWSAWERAPETIHANRDRVRATTVRE
ncbi:MAG: hypothetical protein HY901_04310 [Deltaproteobacteria bacterium]|nr:hypothetical protein [Deltaproteobacteria bacterium]